MIGRFEQVMIVQIPVCQVQGIVYDLAEGTFLPIHRQFVETLRANLNNNLEFELVWLSCGNAVRRRSVV